MSMKRKDTAEPWSTSQRLSQKKRLYVATFSDSDRGSSCDDDEDEDEDEEGDNISGAE